MPNWSGMQNSNDMNFSEETERIIVVITAQLREITTEMGDIREDFFYTITKNKGS